MRAPHLLRLGTASAAISQMHTQFGCLSRVHHAYEGEYPCGCVAGTTTHDFPPKSYTIKRCSETELCGIEIEKRRIEREAEEADRDLCKRVGMSLERLQEYRSTA